MDSVYVSEIPIYMYTLPQKKRNFPEVAFLGEECRSVNFRPNGTALLGGHVPGSLTLARKNLEMKIVFLLGKSVFPKNHPFVCLMRLLQPMDL